MTQNIVSPEELPPQLRSETGPWSQPLSKIANWLLDHYLPLGSLIALSATAFYGLAYARIYESVGIAPEEVGFTPASLLTHAAVGGLALFLLISLFIFCTFIPLVPLRDDAVAREEKGSQRQVLTNGTLTLTGIALMSSAAAAVGFFWVAPVLSPSAVMLFFLSSFRFRRQDGPGPIEPRPLRFRLSRYMVMLTVLALPLGLLFTGAVTFTAANHLGERIKRGEGLLGVEFAGVPFLGVRAEPALVSWVSRTPDAKMPRCMLFLGDSDGESVFYDARSKSTFRLPTPKVVIQRRSDMSSCKSQ